MAAPDVLKVSILGSESIHVGFHLIPYIVSTTLRTVKSSVYVIITDTTLAGIYLDELTAEFEKQITESAADVRPRILTFEVAPGEGAKSREQKSKIEDFMLENKCTRDAVVMALGGGVVGDLSGFVAATYMRGVKVIQIPTTLLAMVDSSVGGKTAVDTPHGKNFIGAFHQPTYIFVDLSFLESLSQREFSNGMAEVIKTAAIWKEDDFASLESRFNEITSAVQGGSTKAESTGRFERNRTEAQRTLLQVVTGSIFVKAHIVTIDEKETGLRNLVNFGHTIGHAIEAVLSPQMLHGECVAVGMILEAEVARQLGTFSQVGVGRLTRCLKAYGLPVSMTDPRITKLPSSRLLSVNRLLDIMKVDKKNSGAEKKVVLLSRIGKTWEEKATAVKDSVISRVLSDAVLIRASVPRAPSSSLDKGIVMSTPGSKSISNRALVLAALGKGTCRMRNLLHSDDTAVMMAALVDLQGAQFAWEDGGDTLVVTGGGGKLVAPSNRKHVYLGNAGTAARILTAVCTLVGDSAVDHTYITGNARMKQRPIGPLVDALRENGSSVDYLESEGCLPLKIKTGGMEGGHINLAASVSSQYVTAILLCAPYAKRPVTLELTGGQVISQPYIDMTIAMMSEFGVRVERKLGADGKLLDIYTIPQRVYRNPELYNVESDASSATYPLAIAAITGTTCTISNIGSSSLQGDAGFAKKVLEPMGCIVAQSATETTVTGPPIGSLKALGSVDMETMTDAFLTATVLAAVAHQDYGNSRVHPGLPRSATRIHGIANQRVKECNRIKAMRDELAKFGVQTDDFDDGIIIFGTAAQSLKSGVHVHCYDDHRVGMAFSVLAMIVPETIITEKRCVEKTWPNWWDDLDRIIGGHVEGYDLTGKAHQGNSGERHVGKPAAAIDASRSVLLIGMRGAGKTHIGTLAAISLERPFVDADDYFAETTGQTIAEYVGFNGWPAFRAKETQMLKDLVQEKGSGHVISLGGGLVETAEARNILTQYISTGGIVVYVAREIDEINVYLEEIGVHTPSRPSLGEPTEAVYARRQPWFAECSNYEYVNYTGIGSVWNPAIAKGSATEVARFFRFISGKQTNRPELSRIRPTSFLSLTQPDLSAILSGMGTLTEGADAIELRVDLLSSTGIAPREPVLPSLPFVALQLAALRHHTELPIVYTVRTKAQGGFFPDNESKAYAALLALGRRAGCEYLDLEVDLPSDIVQTVSSTKGNSHVIASWHDWSGEEDWTGPKVAEKYAHCLEVGDIAKLVMMARSPQTNTALAMFLENITNEATKPLLAINMGRAGQVTRVLNPILTPITHPALPSAAAPGQMSAVQIHQARHLLGLLPAQQYYLFGSPISASLSPIIHNTGFQVLGLPHQYSPHETASFDESNVSRLRHADFGGSSVTIPHKLSVMQYLDEISDDARVIGAVNTVIAKETIHGRRLHGDNTDWRAILNLARSGLPDKYQMDAGTTAIVIGAGGTCRAAVYALHRLGVPTLYLFNRTPENAAKVKASFPSSFNIVCTASLSNFPAAAPSIIVSTVPGNSLTTVRGSEGMLITEDLFRADAGGVVIDMAYKPNVTPLLELAQSLKGKQWTTVTGVDILLEQAFHQFEMWTGKRAPKRAMREAALAKYNA